MEARIEFKGSTALTVFPKVATGHVITAQSGRPGFGGRVAILTDDTGFDRLTKLLAGGPATVKVNDLLTESIHTLARADCGLGCKCAVRIMDSKAK